jgi:hypothetical protein
MQLFQGRVIRVFRRSLAVVLIALQVLFALPAQAWARESSSVRQQPEPPPIAVNRTVPLVAMPPSRPVFSQVPTDAEILRARVFPEPLVPVGASTSDENVALGAALLAFVDHREPNTLGPIATFMERHPTSVWEPSLVLNAGMVLQQQGFFTRAGHDFRTAWTLTKDMSGPNATAVADRAIGLLLVLESRLGHADILEALIADVGTRVLMGAAAEQLSNAEQALWVMRTAPDEAFRCGPYALAQMLRAVKAETGLDAKLLMTRTGPDGMSLARLAELGRQSGVATTAIVRESGSDFAIPGVVHLKAGHFAAILRHDGDRYLLRDATMTGDVWVNAAALNEEASGAMLAVDSTLPPGWHRMASTESASVWGRGFATGPASAGPVPRSAPKAQCNCGGGSSGGVMAT